LNIQVSLTATSEAKSGIIELIMDNSQYSWSNSIEVSIIKLPDPVMTFASVEINGETWNNVFGSGKHPSGVAINYTWLVENKGEADWSPSVVLSLGQDLFGECDDIGTISIGSIVPMKCTVLISSTAAPLSEPEFNLIISDDLVSVNQTVTMLVAETKEVNWKVVSPTKVQTGEDNTIQLTITNQGNVRITSAVNVIPPTGWVLKFDGIDSIDIEPGQSNIVRLTLTTSKPGEETISISLSGDDIVNSETQLTIESEGEEIRDESSNINLIIISSVSVLLSLIIMIAIIKGRMRRSNFVSEKELVRPNQNQSITTAVQCFSCRLAIEGGMLGCSSCGARYHLACSVKNCVHCGADKAAIVNA